MTNPATAPVREIGYAQNTAHGGYWWMLEDEQTPELVWPQSVFVYDSMRRTDAQVQSVLRAVTLPVRRTPWRIDPNGARDEVVELVATDLGLPIVGEDAPDQPMRLRDRFSWPEHLRQALLMLPFGHSYFEIVFRVDPDGNRAHLRKLAPRPAKTIQRIDVARDGGLISITQYPGGPGGSAGGGDSQEPIPVGRLVAYIHDREGGNWLGTSVLRPAYKNWLLKDRLLRVQAQTIERNGMGIPLYKGQEGASTADIEAGKDMAKAWRAGEAAGSAVPFGADLVLRGVEGTLPDALPVIKYHDEQTARAVLAHFLNLDTQSHGSYALGSSFMDFFTLSLQTLAQQIADTATMHVVEDIVDANWGPDEPAPRLVFDEIGSRQAATAQAIKLLIDAGIIRPDEVLEEATRQQYGLPPRDPDSAQAAPDGEDGAQVDADAIVSAIDAFRSGGKVAAAAGPDFARLHPRGTKGRFRDTFSRILHGLTQWAANGGKGDPFEGFDREPLRRVAVARGLSFKRGASRDDIADALLGHLREALAGKGDGHDVPDAPDAKPAAKKAVPKKRPGPAQKATPGTGAAWSDGQLMEALRADGGGGHHGPGTNADAADLAASRVVPRWDVTPSELEALAREDGDWNRIKDFDFEEQKRATARRAFYGWNGSSGDPVPFAGIVGLVHAQGLDPDIREADHPTLEFLDAHPEMRRAIDSLAQAVYETTQEWFRERGVTSVEAHRASMGADTDARRPWTSWAASHGGTTLAGGGRTTRTETIPVERIFSIPTTGYGSAAEDELVVLPEGFHAPTPGRETAPLLSLDADGKPVPVPSKRERDRLILGDAEYDRRHPPAAPDPEASARARQADIDHARRFTSVAGELDELLNHEALDEALLSRLDAAGRRHGISDELAPVLDAVRAGDRNTARAEMARLLPDGVTQDSHAGVSGRFDPKVHAPISGSIAQGAPVEVVRPGFTLTRDGEQVRLSKAVVEEVGEPAGAVDDLEVPPVYEGQDALLSVSVAQSTLESAEWNRQNRAELNDLGLSDADIATAVEAIAAYQHGGEFETINRALETGDADPGTRARADAIQRVAEASPLLSDVVVWRGEGNPAQGLAVGDTWTRMGFSSTSTHEPLARQFAFETPTSATPTDHSNPTLFRIHAAKGTPALHLDALGEDEILLGAGLEYRVTADHGVVDGVRRVDVEVVPATTTPDPLSSQSTLDPEATRDILDLKKVKELQDMIREVNARDGVRLPTSGRKRDLVDRLVGHVHGEAAGAPDRQARVDTMAARLHEDWRRTFHETFRADPANAGKEPARLKTTKDQAWIAAHGTDQVDIANTDYADLPEDWQRENAAAAAVIEGILTRRGGTVDLNDEATRLAVGEEIHAAWLERNDWARGGDLDVSFADLPKVEQDKDIDQLRVAMGTATPAPGARTPAKKAAPKKAAVSPVPGVDLENMSEPDLRDYAKRAARTADRVRVRDLVQGDVVVVYAGRHGAQGNPGASQDGQPSVLYFQGLRADGMPRLSYDRAGRSTIGFFGPKGSDAKPSTPILRVPRADAPGAPARAASYPERAPVVRAAWSEPAPGYRPPYYVAPSVLANDKTTRPGGWADPEDVRAVDHPFTSLEGPVTTDERGRPRNPRGRTGIEGRGLLGKWGANPAADPIITRTNPDTGQLEMAAIARGDTGQWAIPGGMVDDGETASDALAREFREETGADLDMSGARVVYRGYVDDPRNTDNAWVETTAMHRHLTPEEAAAVRFTGPADAAEIRGIQWLPLTDENMDRLYASHADMVREAVRDLRPAPSLTRDERIRALVATGMTWKEARAEVKRQNAIRAAAGFEDDEPDAEDEDDPGPPDDEQRARALARLAGIDETIPDPSAVQAAAGHDITPGHDFLHHWWTRGPGLRLWVTSPTPWRTLLAQLQEHVKPPKPLETLKRWVSAWYIEVFGHPAGRGHG